VIIDRRPDLEAWLLDEMRVSLADTRAGDKPHLSDLLSPRQAAFSRLLPKPPTDAEIGYWVAGRGHEDVYGRVSGLERGSPSERFGIVYSKDFFKGWPVELKTRRRNLAKPGMETETYAKYIDQVRGYCAMDEMPAAWLIVFSLVEDQPDGSTLPGWGVYHLTFTELELEAERARMQVMRDRFLAALEAQDPRSLPLCVAWMCGKQSRTMATPPVCRTCRVDGEPRVFATDWGIAKHQESVKKRGQAHDVSEARYTFRYVSRCKWFHECRPWEEDFTRGPGPTL
jgi:hypothetical protein